MTSTEYCPGLDGTEPAHWSYDEGLIMPSQPVLVHSLGADMQVWVNAELPEEMKYGSPFSSPKWAPAHAQPSEKQQAAWRQFDAVPPEQMKRVLAGGLRRLADRMDALPPGSEPEFGPSYYPEEVSKASRNTASMLDSRTIQEVPGCQFSHVMIPHQQNAPVQFVLLHFAIACDTEPPWGYELEALFADAQIVFIGEDSGLWTRTEWEYDFNSASFDPATAVHPYW